MNKSDIVIEVIKARSIIAPSEKHILKELCSVLLGRSIDPETWDGKVGYGLARSIIKHVGSVRGRLSMSDLVRDIDLLVERKRTVREMV